MDPTRIFLLLCSVFIQQYTSVNAASLNGTEPSEPNSGGQAEPSLPEAPEQGFPPYNDTEPFSSSGDGALPEYDLDAAPSPSPNPSPSEKPSAAPKSESKLDGDAEKLFNETRIMQRLLTTKRIFYMKLCGLVASLIALFWLGVFIGHKI